MKKNCLGLAFAVVAWISICVPAQSAETMIHTDDVDLFYKVYDAADGHPTAEQLQRDYLDAGSEGLHNLAKLRNVSGVRIADTLSKHPELYVKARGCTAALPRVRERVEVALRNLVRLYPQARTPPVTIAVGRGKPVGVGSPVTGLQIGLEALCSAEWMNPNVEDRFVHVIAHEYAHVQQVRELVDDEHPTVLERSLTEGAAEFVAALTSGKTGYAHFDALTKGREREIETAFVADVDQTEPLALGGQQHDGEGQRPRLLGRLPHLQSLLPARHGQATGATRDPRAVRSARVPRQERLAAGNDPVSIFARSQMSGHGLLVRLSCNRAARRRVVSARAHFIQEHLP
jgi:hypothetical protein